MTVCFSGCGTLQNNPANPAAELKQAMSAEHKSTISLLHRVNEEQLPFRIEQGIAAASFSKADLYLIEPSDIAAWDMVLTGLDDYCEALDALCSDKSSASLTAASENLGLRIQSLMRNAKWSGVSSVGNARTAVSDLGGILVKYKASRETARIAKAADPSFQAAIRNLVDALGFAGSPSSAASHGLVSTCEANFQAMNAERSGRRFKGDAIAGYDAMTPAERRAGIKDFVAWLGARQDHVALVESMKALAVSLEKTAAAHAALAAGSEGAAEGALAELRSEIRTTLQLCQNPQRG